MKKNKNTILVILLLVVVFAGSCKKHHTQPKVPPPAWQVDNTGKYSASMTAVVMVPQPMQHYVLTTDQMGAFIGSECRGTGTVVTVGGQMEFFILIHGTPSEQSKISFKYYSAWYSTMYQTTAFLPFMVDGNYGSADGPEIIDLQRAE